MGLLSASTDEAHGVRMSSDTAPLRISPSIPPTGSDVIIFESSFFKYHSSLPSLKAVRSQAKSNNGAGRNIAVFEGLNLLVKFGLEESIAEGQCLYAIRRVFGSAVPVPEVYAWLQDGQEIFIFMEMLYGVTLERRWDDLDLGARRGVAEELRGILQTLRTAEQDPVNTFIGHICGTPLQDIALPADVLSVAGPFPNVKVFNDWFASLQERHLSKEHIEACPPIPYRSGLPDDDTIKFTHGDLHRSNIIVAATGPPHIVAIIDWHQAGWLPAYWEVCKAIFTADSEDNWVQDYVPRFLHVPLNTVVAWDFYVSATGN